MKFELYGKEEQNYLDWLAKHEKKCKKRDEYHGAIHIGDAFKFIQTSVGHVVEVECICGERKNITDYDCW